MLSKPVVTLICLNGVLYIMAQRRVPQETGDTQKVNRKPTLDRSGYGQFLGFTTPIPSPTYINTASPGITFIGNAAKASGGSATQKTLSFTSNEWAGMIGFQLYGGVVDSVIVNGSTLTKYPAFNPNTGFGGKVDIMDYGATLTINLTGSTYFPVGMVVPDTFIDSNRKVIWPPGIEGLTVPQDI